MKKTILLIVLASLFLQVTAQKDTLRIMQYNLLRYGEGGQEPVNKNPWLKTIVNYIEPDIFGANEISGSSSYPQNVLVNVLNTDGKTYWKKSAYSNTASDKSLVNTLFYNSNKVELKSQKVISAITREIIAFRMYYNDVNLALTQDTVFFTIIVGHLKAGNTPQDASSRDLETKKVVQYLNNLNTPENIIFMGDFNVYTSSEAAYQNLIANADHYGQLFDPINKPGSWNNNTSYKDIHTQSTRASEGGVDDRFDFQICSRYVLNDSLRMKIIPETYIPVGNDGLHFNKGLSDAPANTSVPANVLSALVSMSDHMPVRADYIITPAIPTGVKGEKEFLENEISVVNPFSDVITIFFNDRLSNKKFNTQLFSFDGKLIAEEQIVNPSSSYQLRLNGPLSKGLYLLKISDGNNVHITKKLMAASR
jgi:endonuclease/exonuclease/phosphatase family metal-dependent hydrolase